MVLLHEEDDHNHKGKKGIMHKGQILVKGTSL